MMEFIYFIGRFHVLALHLPVGIICVAVCMEYLAKKDRFKPLLIAANYLWFAAAITAAVTVFMGLMHAREGGFEGSSMDSHAIWGIGTAVCTTAVWLLRVYGEALYNKLQPVIGVWMLIMVTMTGHYGGNLTHGSTYLVEYAPKSVQALVGFESRALVTNIAEADVFLDIVDPMIQRRCANCHNAEKLKGQLSLASHDLILKGGESGPAVVPGDLAASEIYRRISLDSNHEDYMPADSKTPLRDEEVALIGWWIDLGAPASGSFSGLSPEATIQNTALAFLDISPIEMASTQNSKTTLSSVAPASDELIHRARSLGIQIRNVSQISPFLFVDLSVRGGDLSRDHIEVLNALAEQTYELYLKGTNLTDEQFEAIESMPNLTKLDLSKTAITDRSFSNIGAHTELTVLNLHGVSEMTEVGLTDFRTDSSIATIYSWNLGAKP